jgi:TRAP-type mannitol/chloroaromatic compound transport system permease large subunit
MIMMILLAGSLFTGVFAATGGMAVMRDLLEAVNLGPWGMIFLFLGMVFIAGFFLEWISILLIFVPLFMPFVNAAGFDPLWFSMLILIMIQTSYLTPPMAPAIFYLRGIAPPEMTLQQMYRGVIPFILLQVVVLAVVMIFPELVTWLPDQLLGFN